MVDRAPTDAATGNSCNHADVSGRIRDHPPLLKDFFAGQFQVNDSEKSQTYWQVFDRTTGQEVPRDQWEYHAGTVRVHGVEKWHRYTVSFFAYRIWEEISMYNHMTNGWEKRTLNAD